MRLRYKDESLGLNLEKSWLRKDTNEICRILKVVDKLKAAAFTESCVPTIGRCFTELAEDCFKTDLEVGSKKCFLHPSEAANFWNLVLK